MQDAVDNSELIASLIDERSDGDTFWYTELLDRRVKGPSRAKMLRAFEHSDRAHFLEKLPAIRELCDQTGVRAYTRLSPRSRKAVAQEMAKKVLANVLDGQFEWMKRAYAHACGVTSIHSRKLWLIDIDREPDGTLPKEYRSVRFQLEMTKNFVAWVPSRNGGHLICKPHDPRQLTLGRACIHKDNPTNLYIPAGE